MLCAHPSIVETILVLALAANLVALMLANHRSAQITPGIHIFVLAGVSLGMVALALHLGPPPSADRTIHFAMAVAIALVMFLLLIRSKSKSE